MKQVWALGAIVLTLGFSAACNATEKAGSTTTAAAAPITESDRKVAEVETEFATMKRSNDARLGGWATKVQPGDYRSTDEVEQTLSKLALMSERLDGVPANDKVGVLRGGIRELMMTDCTLLLRKARAQQDIWAIGTFVKYASRLDTNLETDFGVTEDNLKKEALAMTKKYVIQNRAQGWNSDTRGGLMMLYNQWLFTPQDMGLTAEEAKIVLER